MSEERGARGESLIKTPKRPHKNVDLDRCTCCRAGVHKRWRNASPYPCIHASMLAMSASPSAKHTLTCLRAWMHQPLLSWVVYVCAHQITLACLRAPGGLQSADIPPAGQRVSSALEQEVRNCTAYYYSRKHIGSAVSAKSYINLSPKLDRRGCVLLLYVHSIV